MNIHLRDIDDLFRSALEQYEETPSPGLKERLEAALDKKNAESYKWRHFEWKKTILLLLLLFIGLALHESGILKTGTVRPGQMRAINQISAQPGGKHKEEIPANIDDPDHYDMSATKVQAYDFSTTNGDDLLKQKGFPLWTSTATENNFKRNPLEYSIILLRSSLHKEHSTSPLGFEGDAVPGFPAKELNINFLSTEVPLSTERKSKAFKPFWMMTAFASYEAAGYRLDSDYPTNITNIKYSEDHEPSFSIGILTTRQLRKQWGIQTGLFYSLTQIGISPQKLFALQDPSGEIAFKYNTSSGYAYIKPELGVPPAIGDSLVTTEGNHNLKFISIPLVVKYSIGKNKFNFVPGTGIECNFLTNAKVETEVEGPSTPEVIFIDKLDGAKTFYLSVVADFEVRYKLNDKLSACVRPGIRYAVSSITKDNMVETFPRSIGVGLGLTWKF